MKSAIATLTLLASLFGFHRHKAKPVKTLNGDIALTAQIALRDYTEGNPLKEYEKAQIALVNGDVAALMVAPQSEDKGLQEKTMEDLRALRRRDDFLQLYAGDYLAI